MTYSGYIKDHPAYCLDHQCRKFHVFKYIMIERKFQALSWQRKKIIFNRRPKKKNPIRQIRLNDRLNINADIYINIPDVEEAYLSSHEGSMKLQHFWFQYHVRHLSVRTVVQLFMVTLTASKLGKEFWSSKKQKARASDFSSNLKPTGSVTIYSLNSYRIRWGFL